METCVVDWEDKRKPNCGISVPQPGTKLQSCQWKCRILTIRRPENSPKLCFVWQTHWGLSPGCSLLVLRDCSKKVRGQGSYLAGQWLGLRASTAGGTGSIPGWRTMGSKGTKILQATQWGKKRGKRGARIYRKFFAEEKKICSQPSEHQKITGNHKNTHLKLMILVWEDARVWAHCNHSFDIHFF